MPERRLLAKDVAERELAWLVRLYPDITPSEIAELSENVVLCTYFSGEEIIEEGEELKSIYLLRKGKVDLLVDEDGHQLSIKVHTGRFILGEVEMVTGQVAAVSVVAVDACEVFLIEQSRFDMLLRKNPGVCYSVLTEACKKVFSRVERYRLPKWPVEQQIATLLQEFVATKRYPMKVMAPNVVEISMRQDELGSRIGLSQSSVSRALLGLESKGVVLVRKRGGLVLDTMKLGNFV